MNADKRTIISALLLVALTLLVLGRLCGAEFVQYDDPQTIANNPAFNPPTLAKIIEYWRKPEGNLYIPITYNVWGALAFLARVDQADDSGSFLNPWVYHTANLLIHCATTLVVFAILRVLVSNCRRAALIGAAIFAVHPVQVEAVGWASGTKDLLCALFTFAAVWVVARHRERPRIHVWPITILLVITACLSKPTGMIAPIMILIVVAVAMRASLRPSYLPMITLLTISLLCAAVARIVQPPVTSDVPPIWQRPLVALDALAFYSSKLIWPAQLTIDYGRTPARIVESGAIGWTWIAPIVIAAIAIVARRHLRFGIAAILLIVAGVAPVLGFVPFTFQTISTVADHYLYPAMLGVALLVASFASKGKVYRWISFALVVACALRSFVAAGTWKNNDTLFANAVTVNPHSAFAHTNWGVALARHGDEAAALDHFQQAVAVDPDYAFGHLNLASLLQSRGKYAEAARENRELLRIYQKQRNFDPMLGVHLQQLIDRLDQLAQPTSQEAR